MVDTADHTLAQCPAWTEERNRLKEKVGCDLTIPKIVEAMLEKEEAWKSFSTFCGKVMREKEDAERIRRGETHPPGSLPPSNRRHESRRRGGERVTSAVIRTEQRPGQNG